MNSPLVLGVNIIACDGRPARREEALPASPGAGGAVSAGGERRLVLLEQAERRAATAGGTSPGILCGGGGIGDSDSERREYPWLHLRH